MQKAIADTATLIPMATAMPVLQATLDTQEFTAANGRTLASNHLTLADDATFNITTCSLSFIGGFIETMKFTL